MRRTFNLIVLLSLFVYSLSAQEGLRGKLENLPDISRIEALKSDHFPEKFAVCITQPVDHKHPDAGSFTQRVVVSHIGFDRPTVLVTEGYGGAYARYPNYQDEVARLFQANIIHVEHRYFLESTPDPLNWDYLTTENSAYDLHKITTTFKQLYTGKWISTGISKGGQTTILYRAWFPDDVDISVPYVAPLNRGVEDGRHEPFLRKVGSKKERQQIESFQKEVLKRRAEILPLLQAFTEEGGMSFRIPMDEVLDYCVLEYPFAFWQWGTSVGSIPTLDSDNETLFRHLMRISSPDYFAANQPLGSFFVQAAREEGYYGYDTKPLKKWLSIPHSKGYLERIMLPLTAERKPFAPGMYKKVYAYLKNNDPKMILIYGENDPWSATRIPDFKGKKHMQIYIQSGGSHLARIGSMEKEVQDKIINQIKEWLDE